MPVSIHRYLKISVNDVLLVQILDCQEYLSCIEPGAFLWKPTDIMTQPSSILSDNTDSGVTVDMTAMAKCTADTQQASHAAAEAGPCAMSFWSAWVCRPPLAECVG